MFLRECQCLTVLKSLAWAKKDEEGDSRLLDNGTTNTHHDSTDNDGRHASSRTRHSGASHECDHADEVDPAHVNTVHDLPGEGEDGKVGQRVGQTDPGKDLNVPKGLVQARLDVGDVTDIIAFVS